jgi:hypothetical protein
MYPWFIGSVPIQHHDQLIPRIWDWVLGPVFSILFVVLFTGEKMKGKSWFTIIDSVLGIAIGTVVGITNILCYGPSNAMSIGLITGLLCGMLFNYREGLTLGIMLSLGLSSGLFAELGVGLGLYPGMILKISYKFVFCKETWRKAGRWLTAKDKEEQTP